MGVNVQVPAVTGIGPNVVAPKVSVIVVVSIAAVPDMVGVLSLVDVLSAGLVILGAVGAVESTVSSFVVLSVREFPSRSVAVACTS